MQILTYLPAQPLMFFECSHNDATALSRTFVQKHFSKTYPVPTASHPAGRTKDNAVFQRLSYIYDAITVGSLAGHYIDLPSIYCQPVEGAVAFIGGDTLHIVGEGFSVKYQESTNAAHLEDRLLIGWDGESALLAWLDAVEMTYYPTDFLTGNPPMPSPPNTWFSFTIDDDERQGVLEREMLARSAKAWGYKTQAAADEDDNIIRTYFFESVADATYALLIV